MRYLITYQKKKSYHRSEYSHAILPNDEKTPLKVPKASKGACKGNLLQKEFIMMDHANVGVSNNKI